MSLGAYPRVLGGSGGGSGTSGSGASTALFTSTASATVANTGTETSVIGTGSGSKTTSANYFTAGQTLVLEASGFYSSAAVDTLNIKLKAGATTVATTGAIAYGALTNKVFTVRTLITCRTTGATGTFIANTIWETGGAALVPQDAQMLNSTTVTLDTTGTLAWDMTATWSTSSASDTITGTNFAMYVVGSATGGGGGTPAGSTNDIQINSSGSFGALTPGAGVSTFLATPTSANLAAAVTGETGTGALVFATSPALTTPDIGTPTAGVLTSCTGLPISTGVSGMAAGAATFLATPTSANLATLVTTETGSGALVFATSPTLVTPALGTPASGVATNLTGLPLTSGVTGVLPVANGGTHLSALGTALQVLRTNAGATDTEWGTLGGGTGTVTVVASGALTSTALMTGGGTTACQTPAATATMDSSGNISTPGTLTVGNAATTAGAFVMTQGTTQSTGTTNITLQAPASVTSYLLTLPGAVGATNTFLKDVGGNGVLSWATVSGASPAGSSGDLQINSSGSFGAITPGSGIATFLATPSSANLAAAITNETGSGALVFATSPALVTPALGTPASGVLTSCTGLPISTGVSGLGSNVATFLATPSSANLIAAVTDETGTGALVFATSPTLVTPALGTPASGVLTNCTGLPIAGGGTAATTVATAWVSLNVTTNAIGASAIDWALSRTHSKTLSGNTTFTYSNATDGQTIVVDVLNTVGNFTVTWPTVLWAAGTPPTQTVGAKHDIYTFVKIGSNIFGSAVQNMS